MLDGPMLLGIQRRSHRPAAGTKRRVLSNSLLSQANNVPFAGDDLAGGHFAGKSSVTHITSVLGHGLNVPQFHGLTPGMFEGMTPKFMLLNDRTPVE